MIKDESAKLESAKVNVHRAWHVIEEMRNFLHYNTQIYTACPIEFDRIEALMCAAATLLRDAHINMTQGDDVADNPPSIL